MRRPVTLVGLALLGAACSAGDATVGSIPSTVPATTLAPTATTVAAAPPTATTVAAAPPTVTATTVSDPDVGPVPAEVAARSTWRPDCPIALDDLAYLTVPYRGFDEATHSGELIVHASVANDIVAAFTHIYEANFPVAEMRVISQADLDAGPAPDDNTTTGFVCRPAVGSDRWSDHALGLAIDINPFLNPYVRGGVVIPELATRHVDRTVVEPGMISYGDAVVEAFAAIGWGWGGHWQSSKDWMHFSQSGR